MSAQSLTLRGGPEDGRELWDPHPKMAKIELLKMDGSGLYSRYVKTGQDCEMVFVGFVSFWGEYVNAV